MFNIGAASVGTYGTPAGIHAAAERFGRIPLADLVGPGRLGWPGTGVRVTPRQAYLFEILGAIVLSTPECAAVFAPDGRLPGVGDAVRQPELADSLERLGERGTRSLLHAETSRGRSPNGWASAEACSPPQDLGAYEVDRPPADRGRLPGRRVLTNPPPSAGGILIARALALLEAEAGPPDVERVVDGDGANPGRADARVPLRARRPGIRAALPRPGPLGSTTHISVLDRDGWACAVTCSNGSCSGVLVPGTGVHLNNMLGEQDLNPLGFHRHPPGRRMPSMMAPTVVLRDGVAELVLGSAGSNRIRSAILQTILRVVDEGLRAGAAVDAPRVHFEDGVVYAEPGIDTAMLERSGRAIARFRDRNLFFGGVQAVERDRNGRLLGRRRSSPRRRGDYRRGMRWLWLCAARRAAWRLRVRRPGA